MGELLTVNVDVSIFGAFLFVGAFKNRGPAMLLKIVEGIWLDQTPIPLVIVETILYLDRLHTTRVRSFQAAHYYFR